MAKTALVTGGTGYIAGEIIERLLARGWSVRATARDRAKAARRLEGRWPDAVDRLAIVAADLTADAGWAEANEGVDVVAHVASPFPMGVPKSDDELVIPAREGALRALRFAHAAGAERFVLTSSSAAIAYGHPKEKTRFTAADWTDVHAPEVTAYAKSKTIAEAGARGWVGENAPDMTFCSVNPVAVFGPVPDGAGEGDLSASIGLLRQLMTGKIPMMPRMGVGCVDVRDVAEMHVRAMEAPASEVHGERFVASDRFLWIEEIVAAMRERVGDDAAKFPSRVMPDFMVKLLAPAIPEMKLIRHDLNRVREVDGAPAAEKLGIDLIPARQSVGDTAESLIRLGLV